MKIFDIETWLHPEEELINNATWIVIIFPEELKNKERYIREIEKIKGYSEIDSTDKQFWIRIPFFIDGLDQMNKIFIDKLIEIKNKLSAS
jgi:hypothetical protein